MLELAYIALGSNLCDRLTQLRTAISHLRGLGTLIVCSSVYETEPRERIDQPWFLNAAVALETTMLAQDLLLELLRIESLMGRLRGTGAPPKGPRLIDLDLLLFGSVILDQPGLRIPHPRLQERLFVLAPFAEIAPDLVHPSLRRSIRELCAAREVDDDAGTVRVVAPPLC